MNKCKIIGHYLPMVILISLGLLLISTAFYFAVWSKYFRHSQPPPGWEIVVNGEGKYAARCGALLITSDYHQQSIGMSYRRAVNRAWEQYEYQIEKQKRVVDNVWKPVEAMP